MDIFRSPNRLFDSVSDAESDDIKILTGFPGNPILEILMKNRNCVDSTDIAHAFVTGQQMEESVRRRLMRTIFKINHAIK